MADIDSIKITQNGIETTYSIKDTEGRNAISNILITNIADSEIALIQAGLGSDFNNSSYSDAYDAINAVIPRWKECE